MKQKVGKDSLSLNNPDCSIPAHYIKRYNMKIRKTQVCSLDQKRIIKHRKIIF